MNRTPLFVGGLFLSIVGAGAIWLGPMLTRRPLRTTVPPVDRVVPKVRPSPKRPVATDRAKGPSSEDRVPVWQRPRFVVITPDGAPFDSDDLLFGIETDVRGIPRWIGARGFGWTRVPPTDPDGVVRVRLPAAAPELLVTVREADGRPAVRIPIDYVFDGPDWATTDSDGRARIDSMPAGVLRINVGGDVRSASPVRVRMGVDRTVTAIVEPGWTITVRVLDESGSPLSGATVAGYGFDGPRTAAPVVKREDVPIRSGTDGRAAFVTRIDERLAIVVSASGYTTTTVRAPLADPRGSLNTGMTIRLATGGASIEGLLGWPEADRRRPELTCEPAVLALIREWLGVEDALAASVHRLERQTPEPESDTEFAFRRLESAIPWRLLVRGPAVAEDHVLDLNDSSSRALRLRPEPTRPDARSVPVSAPDAATTSLRGRVTDVKGMPLRGITVSAEGPRAVTDADGQFVVPGVPKGRTLDVVYGWLDGADCGSAVPSEFAPWFSVRVAASDELLALTLPRAAAVRCRLTDGLTGKPLSWARVLILDGDDNVRFDAPVATYDGHISLESLVPGTAGSLFAFAPGLRREIPLALRAGEVVDAGEVGLARGGRVSGTVNDKAGTPIAGAAVAVMEDGRLERGGRSIVYGRDLVLRRTLTDAKGAFVLEGLDTSRPAAIGIAADALAPGARRVLWTEGEDAALNVTLIPGGSVRLQLFDPAGGRVSGAFVDLEDARTGVRTSDLLRRAALGSFVAASDDVRRATRAFLLEDPKTPGVYRLGPVEAGPYDVVVSCPGFQTKRAKFSVPDPRRSIPAEALEWRLDLTHSTDGK